MSQFTHLHVHSHYSILDGMAKVPDLVEKCLNNGMQAMALTDHGVMYGIKEFTDYVSQNNKKQKGVIKDKEKILSDENSTPEQRAEAEAAIAKAKHQDKPLPYHWRNPPSRGWCAGRGRCRRCPGYRRWSGAGRTSWAPQSR